ncbi:MAG: LacI family DNA-binding transcriptional regulator [Alphaproteobacteria bacterium]
MATIKEVAKAAGVSIKTVSRVVNRESSVSDNMRKKVQKVIDNLEYQPNQIAKMMRQQKSNFVGVIADAAVTTPWATEMISAINNTLTDAGKIPLILSASIDNDNFDAQLNNLYLQHVSGIIYATMYHKKIRFDSEIFKDNTVLCNCFDEDNRYSSVVPDDYQGGYDAAQYLIYRGYKNIAYLGITYREVAGKLRHKAFVDAMENSDLPIHSDWVLFDPPISDADPYFVAKASYHLLSGSFRPDAFIVANDKMALQIWEAASKLNLKVGKDFAVIGYDDFTPITQNVYPQLTTMRLPHYELGEAAANLFLDQTKNTAQQHVLVPCPLVERASVPLKH